MRVASPPSPPCCGAGRYKRRGGAAAELALILPVLVTVVLAATDFGRFACNYIAVTNASRAGASYGIMNNYTASTYGAWTAGITQAARDEISQQVGSSNATKLTVTTTTSTDGNGLKRVQVTASYPFTTLIPWKWTGLGLPQSVTLANKVEMRLIR
jgi:Flp pilus assembly protein TadG